MSDPGRYERALLLWAAISFCSLVAANFGLWVVYSAAHPADPIALRTWNYFDSGTFKVVSATLFVPVITLLIEARVKLIGARLESRREERRERQRETIAKTLDLSHELHGLAVELIFYDPGDPKRRAIGALLADLMRFPIAAEHVVNMWTHRFPNLSGADTGVFVYFYNVLLNSAIAGAWAIRDGEALEQIELMQKRLAQIQDTIKNLTNHLIPDVLKDSVELVELEEGRAPQREIAIVRARIALAMERHQGWAAFLRNLEREHNPFLAAAGDADVEGARKAGKKLGELYREDPDAQTANSVEFAEFQKAFLEIPESDRLHALHQNYSLGYLSELADWCSVLAAAEDVKDRVVDGF